MMFVSTKVFLVCTLLASISPSSVKARLGSRDLWSSGKINVTNIMAHGNEEPLDGPAEDNRIVGGSDASLGEYKYYVDWNGGCGASLIAPDIVLSAAHCDGPYADVVVGAYKSGMQATTSHAVKAKIVQKVKHPQYSSQTDAYDFIIMKIDKSFGTDYIVEINRDGNVPSTAGESLTVIGLGATTEGGSAASTLMDVDVPYVPHSTCNSQYGGSIVNTVMLCAGTGGKDSCQGDSGGPIVKRQGGKDIQVGVVSFGEGCSRPNYAGVYARVSAVASWIDQQVCSMSAQKPASCTGGGLTPPPPTGSPPAPSPTASSPVSSPVTSPVYSPTTWGTPVGSPVASPVGSPDASPVGSPTSWGSPVNSPTYMDDWTGKDDWTG